MSNIESEVQQAVGLELELMKVQDEIAKEPRFVKLMQQQKELTEKIALFWEAVKNEMIETDTKSIKGDWGYVTLAERKNYKVDMEKLPPKFMKKTADTTKIGNFEKLNGKLPAGVNVEYTRYITKKIKPTKESE